MHNCIVAITNGSYTFQLQSRNHQAVYVRSIRRNHIPIVYIELKMINGRHIGHTYKGTSI